MAARAVLLLAFAWLTMTASAAPSTSLLIDGRLELALSGPTEGALVSAFWADARVLDLSLAAHEFLVTVYEFERIDTLALRQSIEDRSRSFTLTNATLKVTVPDGWLALYGGPAGSKADVRSPIFVVEGSAAEFGNAIGPENNGAASRQQNYGFYPSAPYLAVRSPLQADIDGPLALKLMGSTVHLSSDENETTYWTGTRAGDVPGRSTARWILVESAAAYAAVNSREATDVAFARVRGEASRWSSATAMGSFEANGETVNVPQGRLELTGRLMVDAAPAGTLSDPRTSAAVSGTVTASSLGTIEAPRPAGSRWGILATLLAAACVGGVGAGILLSRRRQPRFTADEYAQLAYAAADQDRPHDALSWIQRARKAAPTSDRLRLDEARFRADIGEIEEPLRLLDEVADRSEDGEADFYAALLLAEQGARLDDAAPRLARALRRTPAFALEVEGDPVLAALLRYPEVEDAYEAAQRWLDTADPE